MKKEETSRINVPLDLHKAIKANSKAQEKWGSLTPVAQMDFISWVESAKQEETRKRRIERACDMLIKGKRRPCCYSIVPLEVYKALDADEKAKSQWKNLDPIEKRVFLSWLGTDVKGRVGKMCHMLGSGQRRPL